MKNKLSNKALASLMVVGMTLPNTTIVNAVNESEQDSAIIENNDSLDNQINNETQSEKSADEVEENQVDSNEESQIKEVIGQTKFVDENGNIKTVDVYDGTTGEEYNPNARTVNTANMVNFNCGKAGVTTKYTDYYTGQEGYLSKTSAADAAFLGTENGKIKFMISGVTGLVDPQYVEVVSEGTYYASNYEVNPRGKLYHYISNNVNATGNEGNFNYVGAGPSYLTKGVEYYSYDGHYFYTDYNVMIDDYKHNIRSNSVNPNNPYYNYYQYLPLRSKTNITADELTAYINNKASSAASKMNNIGSSLVKYQNQYGVNALLVIGLAALESNWGKSNIAVNKNNIFGIGAFDTDPYNNAYSFNSVDDCIKELMSNYMSKGYLNTNYSNFRGGYLGDKASGIFVKYSSDPYEGEKIGNIAAQIDENYNSKDKNQYTIGIKDASMTTSSKVSVYRDANNSTKLYDTIANQSYAFIIRKKDSDNGYYQVQSDSTLNADRTATTRNSEYDYDENYGYVNKNSLTIINTGNDVKVNQAPVIESAEVTDVTRKGFKVSAKVTDDRKVNRVLAAVWTEKNGQDDLKWYTLQNEAGLYYLDISMGEHNYEIGSVNVHVYAYDDEGKDAKKELLATIPSNQAPTITNVTVSDVTSDSYKITCNVSDDLNVVSVKMPTWTSNNDQDDLIWHEAELNNGVATFTVNRKDHNFEYGEYVTHIYAYDQEGLSVNMVGGVVNLQEPTNVPAIKNVHITDANDDGYTITCEVSDTAGPIKEVRIPTWTYKNDQDDIVWHNAISLGNGKYSCRILRRDHKSEFGTYISHIYARTTTGIENHIELNYHNIVNTTVAQGWTYINGEKYFFDNKGNMVGNMPCKKVVDVSSYNGNIDWETAVKYGDIDGVIIRIVNHPNGSYQEDPQFARNLAACRKYNIPFGVYIYDYSHNTGDAYNEADLVMSILSKYNVSTSELKYNIYFDMERKQSDTGLNSQQMSDVAATFINRVSNYGYRAYIYSYRSLLNEYLNTPYIWSQTNWLAAYTNTMGWNNPYYHGSFGWQYTSGGVIPGFNGNNGYVDVSCWFEI